MHTHTASLKCNYLSTSAPILSPGNDDVAEEKRAVYGGSVQETMQQ